MNLTKSLLITIAVMTLLQEPVAQGSALSDQDPEVPEELTISLEEAIEIALLNNYMVRKGMLDMEMADQQIREAWSSVYPQISASGRYTRNIVTPNPFAGTEAGGLFDLFGALDWLVYNESARTDDDPDTEPISFEEFIDRQEEGMREAGISLVTDDNPFAVDNQFEAGVTISQVLYNRGAFAAIRGARQMRDINQEQFQREQQIVIDQIKSTFYSALLAQEQTEVLRTSVERLERTVEETRRAVEAGILSRYDRISAEVELVNLETELIQAENQVELARKNLSLQLGIPVQTRLHLHGDLKFDEPADTEILNTEEAYRLAVNRRPDLRQSEYYLDLLDINRSITRSRWVPSVNAFASAMYIGQVPDNRQVISPVEGEDFAFTATQRRFFDNAYWDPAIAVGVSFNWSIFSGLQTRAQVEQNNIEIRQAEIDQEALKNSIYLEVEQAVRNLETAHQRIRSQQRNIEQAELNYENSLKRLREGIGTPLEERQASSLLDQSRLNYLSAVHDYLQALSEYRKVTGEPVSGRLYER